jgi:hypothetical protein
MASTGRSLVGRSVRLLGSFLPLATDWRNLTGVDTDEVETRGSALLRVGGPADPSRFDERDADLRRLMSPTQS